MITLPLDRLAAACGAQVVGPGPGPIGPAELRTDVTAVVADSREAAPGAVFVALPGARVDGTDFVAAAVAAGAVAAVTTYAVPGALSLVVADAQQALGRVAREVVHEAKARHGLRVLAVTGSAGKTSTKDLLAQVLETAGPTVAPAGSLNNEIGVPLTAVRVEAGTRFLVSEMGARDRGHIAYLCSITPPDVSLVLNVGHAHLGEFGSQQAIAQAKGEIVEALDGSGVAVLNADDPLVAPMAARTSAQVLTFSAAGNAEADVWAGDVRLDALDRPSFTLHSDGEATAVTLRLVGAHQLSNALAAAAAAGAVGMAPDRIALALGQAQSRSRWRMEVQERADHVLVVNDAYNANPDSMRAALQTLVRLGAARRDQYPAAATWAVLGDMLELGDSTAAEHAGVGRSAAGLGVTHLVCVGENAVAVREGAVAAGLGEEAVVVDDTSAALAHLASRLAPGDVVLVKASRGLALERVAAGLLAGSDASVAVEGTPAA